MNQHSPRRDLQAIEDISPIAANTTASPWCCRAAARWRLSGRRLSGARRGQLRPELDLRRLDRRDQFVADRRQSARAAHAGAGDLLEHGVRPQDLAPHAGGRHFYRDLRNQTSAWMTMVFGQPGFFKPRSAQSVVRPRRRDGATELLRDRRIQRTLRSLVDFDRLNNGAETAQRRRGQCAHRQFHLFRHRQYADRPRAYHGLGRAAARACRAVKIEGEHYWDGGIVSNTPLQHLLDQDRRNLARVSGRSLQRARHAAARDGRRARAPQGHFVFEPHATEHRHLRAGAQAQDEARSTRSSGCRRTGSTTARRIDRGIFESGDVNIVHLIYQQKDYEGTSKDYEFSGTSMREHWQSGYDDTVRTLRHPEWLRRSSIRHGIAVHDLHREDPT